MAERDGLACVRRTIGVGQLPIPVASADLSSAPCEIPAATHFLFPPAADGEHASSPFTLPVTTITRFESSIGGPVDLRSVYLAWSHRELPISDYVATIQRINNQLSAPGGAGGRIQNLAFVERIELVNWLSGSAAESGHIRSSGDRRAGGGNASAAGAHDGLLSDRISGDDPDLAAIYAAERILADHNSVLWGSKQGDFLLAREYCQAFLTKVHEPQTRTTGNGALVANRRKSQRVEPIILVSPSASAILRMSNIKQFLETSSFVPADSAAAGSSSSATILHINRTLPTIDANRPLRFIIVDNPDQFKPEYWDRLVAVFTTGQAWQFKSYKWANPTDLFSRVMGTYIGWSGEKVPENVVSWGRHVRSYAVDKWVATHAEKGRWKDKEVVESFWDSLEESMRARGWTKNGPGGSG